MRRLILHVGEDKTGSSYLQSCLANSITILRRNKIFYPANKKTLLAKHGRISSGNSEFLKLEDRLVFSDLDNSMDILLSGEQLFRYLPTKWYSKLENFIRVFDISQVNCLLFIREPLDHLSSSYQQAIKRGGYTKGIEEFCLTYNQPKLVKNFVDFCLTEKHVQVKILNYSNHKQNLLEAFESFLGIPSGSLFNFNTAHINRSLSFAELEFQRVVNTTYGRAGHFISDALCEYLPNIKPDTVGISRALQKATLERVKGSCDSVNGWIEKLNNGSEPYSLKMTDGTPNEMIYRFSSAQIEVLASAFADYHKQ